MAVTTEHYYTGNNSTTSYAYQFPYYKTSDIKVTWDGALKTEGTHYDVTGTNIVFKTSPTNYTPANNVVIRIYRDTDVDTSKATFAAGSSIRATDLNNNELQLLYSAQEEQTQLIVTGNIKDGAVTSDKIKDGAVTSDQIGAGALTYAKIQNVTATDRVLGRDSSGAGVIEEITPAALRTMINVEDGSTGDQTNAEIRTAVEAASDSNVFTDADHTKLNAIAAGAEANVQPDWNASSGDAQILNKPTIPAAQVQSDWNATSGLGVVLNKPTIPELIDEDNFGTNSDTKAPSQQSTKAYIAATSQPLDTDLTTLAGMPSATASILASSTALSSTTAELNLLDGKSVVTSVSGSSTDVQLPTAKAVNDALASLQVADGNFVPIADINAFPESNPDPGNNAGTIVSIADAGGLIVNSSGVATNADSITSDATITINGIDTSLRSTTIAAGKGMLVQTTSTTHTYDYHRLIVDEAGVATAQTLVNDFNSRYQVASSAPSTQVDGTALQDGDLWFDTTANEMKVYDLGNTTYSVVSSVGNFYISTLSSYSGTGGNVSGNFDNNAYRFVLSNVPTNAQQLIVSINGVIQKPNSGTGQPSEGFAVNGSSILFSAAPATGSNYFIIHIGASVNVGTPSNNTVTSAILQNGSVTTEKLADQAVELTKIVHGTSGNNGKFLRANNGADPTWEVVDTTIADDSITEAKLDIHADPSGTDKYLGYTSNGMEWTTVAQYTTPLTTRGDILFRDASGDQRLAKGTSGQYLKIGANDPEWADVEQAVADGCIYLNNQTISSNYTMPSGKNGMSAGPITISGSVTIPNGGSWSIV